MKPQKKQSSQPAEIWRNFLEQEQKSNSKLGKLFAPAIFGGHENENLTLFFPDDNSIKAAKGQIEPVKTKLLNLGLRCDRINFRIGTPAVTVISSEEKKKSNQQIINCQNPLQALIFTDFGRDRNNQELTQPVLENAAKAEGNCHKLYEKLNQRTVELAGGEANTIKIDFNWRMRVGGTRGFRELILPILHPVFGIPYIPASSLKGAVRNWAKKNHSDQTEICELLGFLEGKIAKAAKIEFLDAFPTKPCLSVDVSTPQWKQENDKIIYKPEPHPLLSLENPQILIGLRATSPEYIDKIPVVKQWLENALNTNGLGARISGGYGRTLTQEPLKFHKTFDFEFWTQGLYGSNPPSKENRYQGDVEFRPTAIRGILRYWFRAIALGIYDQQTSAELETLLFGDLGKQGLISISTRVNPSNRQAPYFFTGKIILEAANQNCLNLLEQLLILATHLGGFGRGSRRPLHLLDQGLRGCHWTLNSQNLPLPIDAKLWKDLFAEIYKVFKLVKSTNQTFISSPGTDNKRQQDVFDKYAQVWLLKNPDLVNPEQVKNWQTEGGNTKVRGAALSLLYSDTRFKGVSKDGGNSLVGGKLGTPSFVWIKSIFPYKNAPYQVVTIFGANHPARQNFAKELKKLGAILVYGQIFN